eukprot:scaffold104782_cov39-Phaeocystis_antarctica.AAC.2
MNLGSILGLGSVCQPRPTGRAGRGWPAKRVLLPTQVAADAGGSRQEWQGAAGLHAWGDRGRGA